MKSSTLRTPSGSMKKTLGPKESKACIKALGEFHRRCLAICDMTSIWVHCQNWHTFTVWKLFKNIDQWLRTKNCVKSYAQLTLHLNNPTAIAKTSSVSDVTSPIAEISNQQRAEQRIHFCPNWDPLYSQTFLACAFLYFLRYLSFQFGLFLMALVWKYLCCKKRLERLVCRIK